MDVADLQRGRGRLVMKNGSFPFRMIGAPLVLAALVLLLGGFDSLDPETIECEQAIKHAAGCCPSLHYEYDWCSYSYCDDDSISEEEAQCVQDLDCAEVVARDVCGRLEQRLSPPTGTSANTVTSTAVCP